MSRSLVYDLKTLHCKENTIMCCGTIYTNTSNTIYDSLFDSTTCVSQAIPLDECGNVIYDGLSSFRKRLIHYEPSLPIEPADPSFMSNIDNLSGLGAPAEPAPPTSVFSWFKHLLHPTSSMPEWNLASAFERRCDARQKAKSARYLFNSPYWVETASLSARWGVSVASSASPININDRLYVNAEETTDASRFNPRTCTPKRLHEVLWEDGLRTCTWERSEGLRREISHYRAWSGTEGFSKEENVTKSFFSLIPDVDPNTTKTMAFLNAEADKINRMCNLWVSKHIVKLANWHLKPNAIHSKILAEEMTPITVNKKISEYSFSISSDESNTVNSTLEIEIVVVYAEDIIEREELAWLMSYHPTIYYYKISPPTKNDNDFVLWQNSCRSKTLPSEPSINNISSLNTKQSSAPIKKEEVNGEEVKKDSPLSSNNYNEYMDQLYSKIMKKKRFEHRSNFRLTTSYRLELALIALRERYPRESRETWVTMSFLEEEAELKLRDNKLSKRKAAVIDVELTVYKTSDALKNSFTRMVRLINHAEIDWPEDSKKKYLAESWVSAKA
ncbi:unnamed protein product [Phytomonas sp. Hart1]|nr:unnamed protein product [Phytomonas sp. Hart1]|eukprot:CCW68041.1 unnamed protein product [Phytomonas sp. isolate Hart1]